jgi:hypothetical protein
MLRRSREWVILPKRMRVPMCRVHSNQDVTIALMFLLAVSVLLQILAAPVTCCLLEEYADIDDPLATPYLEESLPSIASPLIPSHDFGIASGSGPAMPHRLLTSGLFHPPIG